VKHRHLASSYWGLRYGLAHRSSDKWQELWAMQLKDGDSLLEKPLEEAEDEGEVGMLRRLEQKHLE